MNPCRSRAVPLALAAGMVVGALTTEAAQARKQDRARPAPAAPAAAKPVARAKAASSAARDPGLIAFPLDGKAQILDTFGEERGGGKRKHEGVDMMAKRRTPVLAVADGLVSWTHDEVGGRCCALEIRHDDGFRSRYIHLDNDTEGTDDGMGFGIAPGVVEGSRVVRGQLIGWVGDSGNAEACDPHLHFELRGPDGVPMDPRPMLLQLQGLPAGALCEVPPQKKAKPKA